MENTNIENAKNETIENNDENPVGIGGWLILVLIGLIVTPIRVVISLISEFSPLLEQIENNPILSELKPIITAEIISNMLFFIFALVLLIFMLNKYKYFPRMIIIFYISNLIFVVSDAIIVSNHSILGQVANIGDSIIEIMRSLISTAIWVPYFIVSKRVKNTFVN